MARSEYSGEYRWNRAAFNPHSGWVPGSYMVDAPMYGWGWWGGSWGWPPYGVRAYGYDFEDYARPRAVEPRESGTYGREADRSARQWARRYGYDVETTIRPSPPAAQNRGFYRGESSPRPRSRYDRGYRGY